MNEKKPLAVPSSDATMDGTGAIEVTPQIGLLGAVAIGIGGMVGGGIFAVLGTAVAYAHGGTPVAFLFSGIVALLTAYSYAKLSVTYPSQGGTVIYINQAFGVDLLTGTVNLTLWLSYLVTIALYAAALLATFSAINATIYGNARLGFALAKDGELPKLLERKAWARPVYGVFLTAGLSLLLANLVDLTAIAIMGSAGFLIIFAAVNVANVKLAVETGANRLISSLGFLTCVGALAALLYHTAEDNAHALWVVLGIVVVSFLFELVYPRISGRKLRV